jgi:ABC-type arginine transport system permease subunit
MMITVILSYLLAGVIDLFYGHYNADSTWFMRSEAYAVVTLIFEVPDILFMYIIHYRTYRPV